MTRRTFLLRAAVLGLAGAGSLLGACQQPTSPARPADSRSAELKTAEPKPPLTPTLPAKPVAEAKPGQSTPSGQTGPAAGPPKPGGSMVWAAEMDPLDLDPHTSASASSVQAWGDLTYQSLVMFDENMKLAPCLAEAWLNTSPTTWTFKLRQGVTFHDGSEFEAEDVKLWYDRVMAPATAAPARSWFSRIVNVEPKGRYEVEFTLGEPYAPFLSTFAAMRGSAMVPRGWMQGAGAASKRSAVGSGPFKIAEYVPGSHIRYVKHPDYWERGLPYLDEVMLTIVPDEEARAAGLHSGQVKYAIVGPDAARRLKGEKKLTVLAAPGPRQRVTHLNTRRAPFDDVRVRQAIALTVDRQAAIEKVLAGEGKLTGPMPTGHGEWAIPPDGLPYQKDLATAKRLLAEAGHPNGFASTIKTSGSSPIMRSTSVVLADQLRAIGITLEVEQMEPGALARALALVDFDLLTYGNGFLPDPDSYFSQYGATGPDSGVRGPTGWENTRYDEIVRQARAISDPGQRKLLYDEAAGILMQEAPSIWWFTENSIEVVHSSVKGYSQSYTGRRIGLKKTWLGG